MTSPKRSASKLADFLFVPDTTVVSNFALIDRMALLDEVVRDHGAWCATVASECAAGAQLAGLEQMAMAMSIFGSPLYPQGAEHVDIRTLQEQMLKPGDDKMRAHLGEAETITIISSRGLNAAFVTDDRDARRQAASRGIPVYTTWHILKLAVAAGKLSLENFLADYETLVRAARGHPPCAPGVVSVTAWVRAAR